VAERSATASEAADHRVRTPQLAICLVGPFPDLSDRIIYSVRNHRPQDLDDVTIYRPRPPDRIEYHLAVTGSGAGWAEDEISTVVADHQFGRFFACALTARYPKRVSIFTNPDERSLGQ
jgi:hypothetical protein